ncbi:Uncharacterised protein [Neisseria gonorrhoeae]|nr:Uncharacterised protein [Neisseria gonorrhoeae]
MDFTAKSKSASFNTMAGALPPSSSETLVMLAEAASITWRPASTEPVRLTISTCGWADKALPISAPGPSTTLNTPGQSDRIDDFGEDVAVDRGYAAGFDDDGVARNQIRAHFAGDQEEGEVRGKMPAITPSGRLNDKMFSRGRSLWMISPS